MFDFLSMSIPSGIQFVANCSTIIALIVVLIQLYLNRKTQKITNSIQILSWFDTPVMAKLLKDIKNENLKKCSLTNRDDNIDLLYYLDTICALIKFGGILKKFFYQMNHDFIAIKDNKSIDDLFSDLKGRFPNLNFRYLINKTAPKNSLLKCAQLFLHKNLKTKQILAVVIIAFCSTAYAESIQETLTLINSTKQELIAADKIADNKIKDLKTNNPLYSPKSVYESDKDYLSRMTQAIPQMLRIRDSYISSLENKLSLLRGSTFSTSNLTITMLNYDANSETCQLNVIHHDYKRENIKITLSIKKADARELFERWESIEKKGSLSIDTDDTVNLTQIEIKDPISGLILIKDLEPYKVLSEGRVERTIVSYDGSLMAFAPGSAIYSAKDFKTVINIDSWSTVDISPDNKLIAYGIGELTFLPKGYSGKLIDLSSKEAILEFNGGQSLSFSPDGEYLGISIWNDGGSYFSRVSKTVICNVESGEIVYEFGGSGTCQFSPDGRYFACAGGIIDLHTGIQILSLSGDYYSFNNKYMTVAVSNEGKVVLVDLETQSLIKQMNGQSACFSRDGRYIAVASSNETNVYEYPSLALRKSLQVSGPVCFSPDNLYIIIGGGVYRTHLYNGQHSPAEMVTAPPSLTASVILTEPSGNQYLDALETGKLRIEVINSGQGVARDITIDINPKRIPGLNYANGFIAEVPEGKTVIVEIPIEAYLDTSDKTYTLNISFDEANGFPPAPIQFTFSTRSYKKPQLAISDIGINDTNQNGKIEPGEMIVITLRIRNNGVGTASGAYAKFYSGENVFLTDQYSKTQSLGDLQPGQSKDLLLEFFINDRCTNEVPLYCDLTEATGLAGVNKLRVPVMKSDQVRPIAKVIVTGIDQTYSLSDSTSLRIDVEKDIPISKHDNKDDFAVIFGVESYAGGIPRVLYAMRDATWFREYALKTLGIPEQNIYFRVNEGVTKNEFDKVFGQGGWLDKRAQKISKVYFYFCGHGIPSLADKSAFLLPYDGDPNYAELTSYPLISIYNALASLKSSQNSVILDACFTGISRENQALYATSRPVFISQEKTSVPQWVNVLSAADWNQMSNAWPEKQHGLFTYFLLKGMQGNADSNQDRKISLAELYDYLESEVPIQAGRLDKEQTPQLSSQNPNYIIVEFK